MVEMQRQRGGDDSINLQVSGDMVLNSGVTASDVIGIAEYVFRCNFPKLQEEAAGVAADRADQLVKEVIERLDKRAVSLDVFADPAVQHSLYTAQRDSARSSSVEHRKLLAELLVGQCASQKASLEEVVYVEALETAHKLTPRQISALTVSWLLNDVKNNGLTSPEFLVQWLRDNLAPFIPGLPQNNSEYYHLQYAGCAYLVFHSIEPEELMINKYRGLFQRGLSVEDVSGNYSAESDLFIPCLHDLDLIQVNALDDVGAKALIMDRGPQGKVNEYIQLFNGNTMPIDQVREYLSEREKSWGLMVESIKDTNFSMIRLSSVGKAIAHTNWSMKTGRAEPLSIWVSDAPPKRPA